MGDEKHGVVYRYFGRKEIVGKVILKFTVILDACRCMEKLKCSLPSLRTFVDAAKEIEMLIIVITDVC